ncbi:MULTISPECIES: carbon-nitrogen hydrolase family protein [Phyllobacteriaceae]|jgi:N-carbamoylputrescine amidase|uniref:Nitrilase n=2 Tax=Pseudomonadota TaxID=1224 RepID=A0A1C2DFK6_9HYPH|nr:MULTISPECIES: carbon-nitrogen hydrolase family protein [Mesorhizobium]MBN9232303.1 carbon-nitrogen hydrolase family protein [Mesorhizobium sp.]MDQ0329899.1 N-carbamoylputrescine amidase [Mesorhizobium sp. YL-MeA3-2017]OCX13530.1 nitrilase [Mesorhizobium hungaricum]
MRVAFVEWPEALEANSAEWDGIADRLIAARPDILITNELPFGHWIAEQPAFDAEHSQQSIDAHEKGLEALAGLGIPAILSSRPVRAEGLLVNEAVAIENSVVRPVHRKHYFPEEPGWYEASWYVPGSDGFTASAVGGLTVGVMLCTDAMFNEHARSYGRQGASLIAIPRAAGTATENWLTAGKMAAIVSGGYVVSSNRVGRSRNGTVFGGTGFAFAPDGALLAVTNPSDPLQVIEIDPERASRQRSEYPCYVRG